MSSEAPFTVPGWPKVSFPSLFLVGRHCPHLLAAGYMALQGSLREQPGPRREFGGESTSPLSKLDNHHLQYGLKNTLHHIPHGSTFRVHEGQVIYVELMTVEPETPDISKRSLAPVGGGQTCCCTIQ